MDTTDNVNCAPSHSNSFITSHSAPEHQLLTLSSNSADEDEERDERVIDNKSKPDFMAGRNLQEGMSVIISPRSGRARMVMIGSSKNRLDADSDIEMGEEKHQFEMPAHSTTPQTMLESSEIYKPSLWKLHLNLGELEESKTGDEQTQSDNPNSPRFFSDESKTIRSTSSAKGRTFHRRSDVTRRLPDTERPQPTQRRTSRKYHFTTVCDIQQLLDGQASLKLHIK